MKKMKKIRNYFFVTIAFFIGLTACVPTKKLTYLQDKPGEPLEVDTAGFQKLRRSNYHVQVNDLLDIRLRSFNEETDRFFNIQQQTGNMGMMAGGGGGGQGGGNAMIYFNGYAIDEYGYIKLPVLDRVFIKGLTILEIEKKIEVALQEYFRDNSVYVKVRLAGIKYTIIGEGFNGQYFLFQNEATIFEAIGNAGGIDFLGNRYEVQIVRMHPDGVKYYELDLTDKRVVSDPIYFIQPNDVINIRPLKQRSWGIGETGFQTFLALLTTVSSSLALILTISALSKSTNP